MKEIIHCYANWRIDVIILLAMVALILVSGESETFLTKVAGIIITLADFKLARYWHGRGRLSEFNDITE